MSSPGWELVFVPLEVHWVQGENDLYADRIRMSNGSIYVYLSPEVAASMAKPVIDISPEKIGEKHGA